MINSDLQRQLLLLSTSALLLSGCASEPPDPATIYDEPTNQSPSAVFFGEDSPGKFLGKGHENVFVCEVNGKRVIDASFDRPVRVSPGVQRITICYREGGNSAKAMVAANIEEGNEYQIRLGEHSWTVVNLRIENRDSGEIFLEEQSIPKRAGETTILIYN